MTIFVSMLPNVQILLDEIFLTCLKMQIGSRLDRRPGRPVHSDPHTNDLLGPSDGRIINDFPVGSSEAAPPGYPSIEGTQRNGGKREALRH